MEYVVSEVFFFLKVKFKEEIRVQGQTLTQHKATESVSADERWGSHTSSPKRKKKKKEHSYKSLYSVHRTVGRWQPQGPEIRWWWRPLQFIRAGHHCPSAGFFIFVFFAGWGWRRKGVLFDLQGGREALLFEFQCPDMLRPPCPSFTLPVACWWGGQRWEWRWRWRSWSCLWDFHLQTHVHTRFYSSHKWTKCKP